VSVQVDQFSKVSDHVQTGLRGCDRSTVIEKVFSYEVPPCFEVVLLSLSCRLFAETRVEARGHFEWRTGVIFRPVTTSAEGFRPRALRPTELFLGLIGAGSLSANRSDYTSTAIKVPARAPRWFLQTS